MTWLTKCTLTPFLSSAIVVIWKVNINLLHSSFYFDTENQRLIGSKKTFLYILCYVIFKGRACFLLEVIICPHIEVILVLYVYVHTHPYRRHICVHSVLTTLCSPSLLPLSCGSCLPFLHFVLCTLFIFVLWAQCCVSPNTAECWM